jgi:hypothetical protein
MPDGAVVGGADCVAAGGADCAAGGAVEAETDGVGAVLVTVWISEIVNGKQTVSSNEAVPASFLPLCPGPPGLQLLVQYSAFGSSLKRGRLQPTFMQTGPVGCAAGRIGAAGAGLAKLL